MNKRNSNDWRANVNKPIWNQWGDSQEKHIP